MENFSHQEQKPITSMVPFNFRMKLAGITCSKEVTMKKLSILQSIKEITEHILLKNK